VFWAQAAGEKPKLSIVKEIVKKKGMDCDIVFLVEVGMVAKNASLFINVFILSIGSEQPVSFRNPRVFTFARDSAFRLRLSSDLVHGRQRPR
jgi:hypothetical protein